MSQKLSLEIVTPRRIILETAADYVTIPGEWGELGILPGHIPLLTTLQSGVVKYTINNSEEKIAVHFGYAEINHDKITILANEAELVIEIDAESARIDQQNAESELLEALKDPAKIEMVAQLQQKIQIATTRQNAVD